MLKLALTKLFPMISYSLIALAVASCANDSSQAPTPAPAPPSSPSKSTKPQRSTPSTSKEFSQLQSDIEKSAYEKLKHETEAGLIALARRMPTAAEAQAAADLVIDATKDVTAPESQDICDSFYMPSEKFRVLKRLPKADPCAGRGNSLVADTKIGVLYLCQNGQRVHDYDFSMGRNGVDKQKEGDRKTPLGIYPVSKPEASRNGFKVVIKIGFPTAEQKAQGITGSNLAIHGPPREFRCAGFLNTTVNWTDGCLAVSSDTEIKEIGRFILQNDVKEIAILPLKIAP